MTLGEQVEDSMKALQALEQAAAADASLWPRLAAARRAHQDLCERRTREMQQAWMQRHLERLLQ